ncbi:hypothetical protein KKH82_02065 [Patescibacteria group bacterium]|nr:hypothetical protein [Patescibacteria group bacterium]
MAQPGETGLPKDFRPSNTYMIGSDNGASLTLDNNFFEISFLVTDPKINPGDVLPIYTSDLGDTWEPLNTTCTVGGDHACAFTSTHLTLFTVGSIRWNNLEFVNQRFRDNSPTDAQIRDAFFGTGGNPSAYTTHRSTSCYPTNIVVT